MKPFDLCVIGGGAAGLTAAAGAAQLGARVALVERRRMGGECLNYGCVPSKALLRAAGVARTVRSAGAFGLDARLDPVDLDRVLARVHAVIAQIAPHDSVERFRALGVTVIEAEARFLDSHTIAAAGERIEARRFVIATGTLPSVPAIEGLERTPYLTNETVFDLKPPVAHLAVLGGGAVGVELAQAFARLGIRVTVIEAAGRVMPAEDPDVSATLADLLRADGVTVLAGHRAERVAPEPAGVRLDLCGPDGACRPLAASHILVAAGREPVLDLDFDRAGVRVVDGRLPVDARMRTNVRHIYACGDVAGPPYFTHMAEHRAGIALRNALFRLPAKVETEVVPSVLFTEPEFARVGLSEMDAQRRGRPFAVHAVPVARADRAATDGAADGFVKLLATPGGRLLGAAILAPHAGELIHECALALKQGLKLSALSGLIHAYPTYSQLDRFAADERMKRALTPARRRWLQRIFRLRGAPPDAAGPADGR
jgi:pyruvate/2-oxoglutarate dehydrogenase complex dihydrolipoamide dehydrogenase (E3) component